MKNHQFVKGPFKFGYNVTSYHSEETHVFYVQVGPRWFGITFGNDEKYSDGK